MSEQYQELTPLRYSSKPIHAWSGNYDYLFRWYAPGLQRWLTRDPLGEAAGLNLYQYVQNTPTIAVDAFGLESEKPQSLFFVNPEVAQEKAFKDSLQKLLRPAVDTASKTLTPFAKPEPKSFSLGAFAQEGIDLIQENKLKTYPLVGAIAGSGLAAQYLLTGETGLSGKIGKCKFSGISLTYGGKFHVEKEDDGSHSFALGANAKFEKQINPHLNLSLSLAAGTEYSSGQADFSGSVSTGVIWKASKNFDVSGSAGVSKESGVTNPNLQIKAGYKF